MAHLTFVLACVTSASERSQKLAAATLDSSTSTRRPLLTAAAGSKVLHARAKEVALNWRLASGGTLEERLSFLAENLHLDCLFMSTTLQVACALAYLFACVAFYCAAASLF